MMRRSLIIAHNDLRLFLRDKAHYFWLFGSPLLFAFFMGFAFRGPGSPGNPKPEIAIENLDKGFMGRIFLQELGLNGLTPSTNAVTRAERGIRIPSDFTTNVLAKKPTKLEFFQAGGRKEAASMVELKAFRALIAINSHLIELAGNGQQPGEKELESALGRPEPVRLQPSWGTRKPVPAGFQQSLPGIMVMFIMMNLLIFGGVTLATERREGVLRRIFVQPISRFELIAGKIGGLMLLGSVQIATFLAVGKFAMKLDFGGNLPWIVLTLVIYAWVAASLGVLIGSVVGREDKIVAVCVLVSMLLAAFGGCWWPLEIIPENVRKLAHLTPTAWAMDALNQLISFGGGFAQITIPLLVLVGFAVAATFGAIKRFRV